MATCAIWSTTSRCAGRRWWCCWRWRGRWSCCSTASPIRAGRPRRLRRLRLDRPLRRRRHESGEQGLDHLRRLDPGQPAVEALIAVGQALVVEAEELEDGGVEVVDV